MRVAIYARVSTNEQTIAPQVDEMRSYCERRGWQVVETYSDEGVSGSKQSRPGLNKLMTDARRRKFDAVLVSAFDRYARSLSHLISSLEEFNSLGIQFVSLRESVDTSTPNGRLIFGIFSSIAEFERSLIIARTKSGMEAARKRGAKIGRPRVAVDGPAIAALRAEGKSWEAIATQTGIARATCQRAVSAA